MDLEALACVRAEEQITRGAWRRSDKDEFTMRRLCTKCENELPDDRRRTMCDACRGEKP